MCLPSKLQVDRAEVPLRGSVSVRRILRQIHRIKYRTRLLAVLIPVAMGSVMSPPVSAFAAEGKRVAFVVGIGTYDTLPDDKQLKNSVNDAEGVSAKLAEIGFQVTKASNLTRQGFYAKWLEVLNSLTEEDTFVLFYSGHGVQIRQQNYLLPRDIPPIDRQREDLVTTEAISLTGVLNDLTQGRGDKPPPKRAVVIIDACRDNPFILPGSKSIKTPSGLAKPSSTRGLFIIYSADENSISLDRLSNDDKSVKYSVFTRALLPLLTRPIPLHDLSRELKKTVLLLTRNTTRGEQRPTAYDGTDGEDFCLPGCVANVAKDRRDPEPVQSVPQQPKLNFTEILADYKRRQAMKGTVPSLQPEPGQAVRQQEDQLQAMIRPPQGLSIDKRPLHIGKDGAPMVLIPAGEFIMGSRESDKYAREDERPAHSVHLDAYYIDQYEVTTARYATFFQETERPAPAYWSELVLLQHGRKPVVGVDWEDASAYCAWARKRLPTEAEWEKAARGTDQRIYPWGDSEPNEQRANFSSGFDFKNYGVLTDVGSLEQGKSPYDVYDMAGNVWEWTADWYDENYYGRSPVRNPKGPSTNIISRVPQGRVLRGGSWNDGRGNVRSADRDPQFIPSTRFDRAGFRCAQDIPK
jgi:formylglycine-generating enzyme required for sulfatase activity